MKDRRVLRQLMISRSLRGRGAAKSWARSGGGDAFMVGLQSALKADACDALEVFLSFLVSVGLDIETPIARVDNGQVREFGGEVMELETGESRGVFEGEVLELWGIEDRENLEFVEMAEIKSAKRCVVDGFLLDVGDGTGGELLELWEVLIDVEFGEPLSTAKFEGSELLETDEGFKAADELGIAEEKRAKLSEGREGSEIVDGLEAPEEKVLKVRQQRKRLKALETGEGLEVKRAQLG